jgi:DNA-directed RNA polymerase I subunit RPA1
MFFLKAVPVMPNKFRPPMIRNNQYFENAQNKILSALVVLGQRLQEEKLDDKTASDIVINMQFQVNQLMDSTLATRGSLTLQNRAKFSATGIKQTLEKKQGLFRKHIMGKRVNFAARSVILPDPSIACNEVSVPLVFAKTLSFPEPVQQHNLKYLRQLVMNGSEQYPGANYVEHHDGRIIDLSILKQPQREALSKRLRLDQPMKVYRHCRDGDMLLMNRQPTLHRPSIMAHRARVISNQKTIRIHYANCKSYNADFDGDEMNMHLPQNFIARAEAQELMQTSKQYSVPTSGEPIRGLIQDHIVSGVLLTCKDAFLDRSEYQHLVYTSVAHIQTPRRIELEPPTIFKPRPLWTGKQVVTTVMRDIIKHHSVVSGTQSIGFNLDCKTKIKSSMWSGHEEEGTVVVRDSKLLTGVLDKNQIGASKYGIIHMCDEIYGSAVSNEMLTSLTRLFTMYLQLHGFTCGLDDCLMNAPADVERDILLTQGDKNCAAATEKFTRDTLGDKMTETVPDGLAKLLTVDLNIRKLDAEVKASLNKTTSAVIKESIPTGLVKQFPRNFLHLMTESGAKGSLVNASQISCLLGQQEFEGRRVKHMISGKTLPCFSRYESSAQAGGYVASRFLTGIKPAEYFFHCMAGRDGLIDTAVKTARSGYLQRCLIKHLEPLSVAYDGSVRLNGSNVVQFKYGGDSVDPIKSSFIHQFKLLTMNAEALKARYHDESVPAEAEEADAFDDHVMDPWNHIGAVSTVFRDNLKKYIDTNPDGLIKKGKKKATKETLALTEKEFKRLAHLKFLNSMCEPGDPVGVLAAQSIGEPSTQMTLNTFHFAGLDVAHVTVGIPRLVELLHGGNVKQAIMNIPCVKFKYNKEPISEFDLKQFASSSLSKLYIYDLLKDVKITESFRFRSTAMSRSIRDNLFDITLKFDMDDLTKYYNYNVEVFEQMVEQVLIKAFVQRVHSQLKSSFQRKTATGDVVPVAAPKHTFKTAGRARHAQLLKEALEAESKEEGEDNEGDIDGGANVDDEMDQGGMAEDLFDKKKEHVSYDDGEEGDEDDDEEKPKEKPKEPEPPKKQGATVYAGSELLENYTFNKDTGVVKISIRTNAGAKRLFLTEAVELTCKEVTLRQTDGIQKAFVIPKKDDFELTIEGFNLDSILALRKSHELLDLNNLRVNDPAEIANFYGIEAARQFVVNEIQQVFDSYGIPVDERHIGLIADYLTFQGVKTCCNRSGLQFLPGPLHKATFETATDFVKKATTFAEPDIVDDPSSQLVFGNLVKAGTGSFDLLNPLNA